MVRPDSVTSSLYIVLLFSAAVLHLSGGLLPERIEYEEVLMRSAGVPAITGTFIESGYY